MFKNFSQTKSGFTPTLTFTKQQSCAPKAHCKSKCRGFTIIETMIAISLFIIIIMAGMGALLNASFLSQKSRDMRSIMDNLGYILEDMSRNIRTGYNYHCFLVSDSIPATTSATVSTPKSCVSGWAIAFEYSEGAVLDHNDQWVYYISDGKIYKSTLGPYAPTNFTQLTPDEVVINITKSSFSVLGAEAPTGTGTGDQQQPFVVIKLVGEITSKDGVVSPFSLQTSASQRLIDITSSPI